MIHQSSDHLLRGRENKPQIAQEGVGGLDPDVERYVVRREYITMYATAHNNWLRIPILKSAKTENCDFARKNRELGFRVRGEGENAFPTHPM
jgi:hypothetical protein